MKKKTRKYIENFILFSTVLFFIKIKHSRLNKQHSVFNMIIFGIYICHYSLYRANFQFFCFASKTTPFLTIALLAYHKGGR